MLIFLTGAAGFIGSHLAERLCARGDEVVGFDNFDPFYPRAIKERNLEALRRTPQFSLVEGDIRSADDLTRALADRRPDVAVHLAALAGVGPSMAAPARYADVNVTGTARVVEAIRAAGVARLVFGSSSSVYGRDSQPPFKETDPCLTPLSPYAATKRASELALFAAHLHGLDVTCLRFFTVYGPRQRPDLAIHKFARLIAAGAPIELFGDGSTSRDYTFVDDIVDGVTAAIDERRGREPGYRIYNLGGSRTTSLARLVELLSAALGKPATIRRLPPQAGDMLHTLADVSLAGRALGYAPKISIEDGIRRFVSWLEPS
jgi:UDP-glucuronate 4-epimerase